MISIKKKNVTKAFKCQARSKKKDTKEEMGTIEKSGGRICLIPRFCCASFPCTLDKLNRRNLSEVSLSPA